MSTISTHVLDTALGTPAAGVGIELSRLDDSGDWTAIGGGETDSDGRLAGLVDAATTLAAGTCRLRFDVDGYLSRDGRSGFYPWADVVFRLETGQHYHVPLLLSPFGYSTYRGS